MQNLVIERYDDDRLAHWGGLIEPEDRSWIIFLDEHGKPEVYWAERDADGGVVGPAVSL